MDENELKNLIEKHETEQLEFKPSLSQINEIVESVSAFSNSSGGKILVGVSNSGKIIGIEAGKDTIERLSNKIVSNTEPKVYPSISVREIERKKIIAIETGESSYKTVLAFGRPFKRVGKSTIRMSREEYERRILEGGKAYWDSKACENAKLEDIDEEKARWFLRVAKKQRGLKIAEDVSVGEALMQLNLLKGGKPTNACMLLFSKEQKFLQSEVKCIRFSGNEPAKPYIDFQTLEGNVFDMIDKAEDFVLRNIRKAIWLVPGQVQREEKYEYPTDALREAIINAVAHRDYESPSKVQVRVFDSCIEVWNPGILPNDIAIEDLKKKHRSVPRNPVLFKQLFWVKYVEDVGGGTLDMIRQCKEWGIIEPEFEIITGAFVVTFRLPPALENLEKLGLSERQIKAVNYVTKKGSIGNKEYQELNAVSKRSATLDLAGLVKKGIFTRVGEGKRDIKYVLLAQKYPKSIQKNARNE